MDGEMFYSKNEMIWLSFEGVGFLVMESGSCRFWSDQEGSWFDFWVLSHPTFG